MEERKQFIADAEDKMHAERLKDVYITDHIPKGKKFLTTSELEDE